MNNLTQRDRQPELMDQPGLAERDHRQALRGLQRINRFSRSAQIVWPEIRRLCEAVGGCEGGRRPLRVLDLACGGGDVVLQLHRIARRERVAVQLAGCDLSDVALQHARDEAARGGLRNVAFFPRDVVRDPLPADYDVIMCSLFLHHLDAPEATAVLRKMATAARRLVLVNDLIRTPAGFALAWFGTRLLSRSPIVHTDGPRSVAAAWTIPEVRELAGTSGHAADSSVRSLALSISVARNRLMTAGSAGCELGSGTPLWDVVVVGAGPAGALLAQQAAAAGRRVLLLDRQAFPRPKVCGGCVNLSACDELAAAGLGDLVRQMPQGPLQRLRLCAGRQRLTARLPGGLAVSRKTFDHRLVEAAVQAGASFRAEVTARIEPCASHAATRSVAFDANGRSTGRVQARIVIAAGGLLRSSLPRNEELPRRAVPRSHVGLGTILPAECVDPNAYPAGELSMVVGRWGYVGLVRVESGQLNVAGAVQPGALKRAGGPAAWVGQLLASSELPVPTLLREAAWQGTVALSHQCRVPAAPRLLAIGDAAGYVEPFTGEGMAWALASARLAWPLVARIARLGRGTGTHVGPNPALSNRASSALLPRPRLAAAVALCREGRHRDPGRPPAFDGGGGQPRHAPTFLHAIGTQMSFDIYGIGTQLPPHRIEQAEAAGLAADFCAADARQLRLLPQLYRRTGVQTRHSVLLETSTNGEPSSQRFYPASVGAEDRGPTTAARMEAYGQLVTSLALPAARQALDQAQLSPAAVTHLITVTCSGFSAPGVDVQLIDHLGIPSHVARTQIGFMGCHGALNGLRVAKAFIDADPTACVLLVAVELCSLHQQYGWKPDQIVSNALFADGAAAIVGGSPRTGQKPIARVQHCGSDLVGGTRSMMSWQIADHGFEMTLSPQVPDAVRAAVGPFLDRWLQSQGLSRAAIGSWAIHPGGPRILKSCAAGLELPLERLADSFQVLAEYGNMSSPTVLFILDRLCQSNAPRPYVLLGFGPGLAIEATLLE